MCVAGGRTATTQRDSEGHVASTLSLVLWAFLANTPVANSEVEKSPKGRRKQVGFSSVYCPAAPVEKPRAAAFGLGGLFKVILSPTVSLALQNRPVRPLLPTPSVGQQRMWTVGPLHWAQQVQ